VAFGEGFDSLAPHKRKTETMKLKKTKPGDAGQKVEGR